VADLFNDLSKQNWYAIFKQNQSKDGTDLVSHFTLLPLHGLDFLHREIE
jgi:hypothetical protein